MKQRRRVRIRTFWRTLVWVLATPALGQEPVPGTAEQAVSKVVPVEVTNLVRQLSAPDFKSREWAVSKLKQFTASEIPLIETFADTDDPELTLRLGEIVEHLRSRVWLVDVDGTQLFLEDYRLRKQRLDKGMKLASDIFTEVMKEGLLPEPMAGLRPPTHAQPERVLDVFIRETLLRHEVERRKITLTEAEKEAAVRKSDLPPDPRGLLSKALVAAAERARNRANGVFDEEERRQARTDAMLARKLLAEYTHRPFHPERSALNSVAQEQKDMTAMIEELKTKATIRKNQGAIDRLLTND